MAIRMTAKFVICVCVQPDFISLQTACFKRFLKQSFDICIVDDSRTEELSQQIKEATLAAGHEYLRCPPHAPGRGDSSTRHADTLMFGWKNMRRGAYTYIGTLDSDFFLVSPLDLDTALKKEEKDILCVKHTREHIYYFWPGCCIWRTDTHNLEDFHWDICIDQGFRADTGGTTYYYWRDHPATKSLELEEYQLVHIPRENWPPILNRLPPPILNFCLQDIPVADGCGVKWWSDVYAGPDFVFFHLRDVSNWQGVNGAYLQAKCDKFKVACSMLLSTS